MIPFTWPENILVLNPDYFRLGTLILITYHYEEGTFPVIPYQWLVRADKNIFRGIACTESITCNPSCDELTRINTTHHKTLDIIDPSELPLFVIWHHTREFEAIMKSGLI